MCKLPLFHTQTPPFPVQGYLSVTVIYCFKFLITCNKSFFKLRKYLYLLLTEVFFPYIYTNCFYPFKFVYLSKSFIALNSLIMVSISFETSFDKFFIYKQRQDITVKLLASKFAADFLHF